AGSNSYSKTQSASIVRSIELYHVQGNGWNDIGYNFLVDKYGQVFEGRYGGVDRPVISDTPKGSTPVPSRSQCSAATARARRLRSLGLRLRIFSPGDSTSPTSIRLRA